MCLSTRNTFLNEYFRLQFEIHKRTWLPSLALPGQIFQPVKIRILCETKPKPSVLNEACCEYQSITDNYIGLTKFSFTIPSEAAKKARTCEMNFLSFGFSEFQWLMSFDKSTCKKSYILFKEQGWWSWITRIYLSIMIITSSAVQKEASAFLYILHISWY